MDVIFREGRESWSIPIGEESSFLLHTQLLRAEVAGTVETIAGRIRAWFIEQLPAQLDPELWPPSPEVLAEAARLAEQLGVALPLPAKLIGLLTHDFVEQARIELKSRTRTAAPQWRSIA
jgi:hypothetical protein